MATLGIAGSGRIAGVVPSSECLDLAAELLELAADADFDALLHPEEAPALRGRAAGLRLASDLARRSADLAALEAQLGPAATESAGDPTPYAVGRAEGLAEARQRARCGHA